MKTPTSPNITDIVEPAFDILIEEQGCLILQNFFTEKDLCPIWDAIDRLAKAFSKGLGLEWGKLKDVPPTERDRMLVAILKQRPDLQSELYDRLQQIPELLAMPFHPKLYPVAKQLLKTECVGVWPRLQVRLDLCADERNVIGWHHDYLYNKGTKHSYTFWMPLVSVVKDMGTLLLAKNSHLVNDFVFDKIETRRRFSYSLKPTVLATLQVQEPDAFSAGDLVIFHSQFVHSGLCNTLSDRARLTLLYRMQNLEKLEAFES